MPNRMARELTQALKNQANELGFPLVGVTNAVTPTRLSQFHQWLASGFAGEMLYLENRRDAYQHPQSILDGCKSLLMLGVPYLYDEHQRQPNPQQAGIGKIARYAQCGRDYHDLIRVKLKLLQQWLKQQCPTAKSRGVVDTAPLHEREFAAAAGLGWVGKNTLLLNREWGSYFFLAALLTDVELASDDPMNTGHCGTCTACLDYCPTNALIAPYLMDARRCLSYVTIENPGLPAAEVARNASGWIFGCDICQEVCPWNNRSHYTTDSEWQPMAEFTSLDVLEVLNWNDDQFRDRVGNTPLWRPRRRGMIRNAILLAGSQRLQNAVDSLVEKLREDEVILRAAAVWALGQIASQDAKRALMEIRTIESDRYVQDAIDQALCSIELNRLGCDNTNGLRD
jgi:epoxyqueuosine reductase